MSAGLGSDELDDELACGGVVEQRVEVPLGTHGGAELLQPPTSSKLIQGPESRGGDQVWWTSAPATVVATTRSPTRSTRS